MNVITEPKPTEQRPPQTVCGYFLVRWLTQGRTALCRSEQGRLRVLKLMGRDCLLSGDLHPDIKERLARIRELPHRTIATLISVDRDEEGKVYAVWEYLEGVSLQAWVCDPLRDERNVARMLRELVIAVEAMHGQGITHGALHEGNILVDQNGDLRLLDVSPLRFDDESADASAIAALMARILQCRIQEAGASTMLGQISAAGDLRQLSLTISRALLVGDQSPQSSVRPGDLADEHSRKLALRWAFISAAAAVLVGSVLVWNFVDSGKAPPQAPRQAMEARSGGK